LVAANKNSQMTSRLTRHSTVKSTYLSLGRPPSSQCHCRPSRPQNRWVDQIRNDKNLPPVDRRRRAVSRGHRRAMLQLLLAKRRRQQQIDLCFNPVPGIQPPKLPAFHSASCPDWATRSFCFCHSDDNISVSTRLRL